MGWRGIYCGYPGAFEMKTGVGCSGFRAQRTAEHSRETPATVVHVVADQIEAFQGQLRRLWGGGGPAW